MNNFPQLTLGEKHSQKTIRINQVHTEVHYGGLWCFWLCGVIEDFFGALAVKVDQYKTK